MLKEKRLARHKKIKKKIRGSNQRPRVVVFKSDQHTYAQVVDDDKGITLTSGSDLKLKEGTKTEKALKVGEELAKKAIGKKIKEVVFDRGGFKYHGRVSALAQGLRKGGLKF